MKMLTRNAERLLFIMLITLLAAACGANEEPATDIDTDDPVAIEAGETEEGTVSTAGDDSLNSEYLTGEWCSRESSSASGTTWIFAEDESILRGKGEALSEGGDVDTFIASGEVVSVGPDVFVFSQAGTEVRFERGRCSS